MFIPIGERKTIGKSSRQKHLSAGETNYHRQEITPKAYPTIHITLTSLSARATPLARGYTEVHHVEIHQQFINKSVGETSTLDKSSYRLQTCQPRVSLMITRSQPIGETSTIRMSHSEGSYLSPMPLVTKSLPNNQLEPTHWKEIYHNGMRWETHNYRHVLPMTLVDKIEPKSQRL